MNKILIIMKSDVITVYDINGTDAVVHKISGEQETYIEDYADVPRALKMMYNNDALTDVAIDVVYTKENMEILHGFLAELLPCGELQVFSLEKILPEVLTRLEKLRPNGYVYAEFDGKAYEVSMDNTGKITVNLARSGDEMISDVDIAAIYKANFSLFEYVARLEKTCAEVKKQCAERIQEFKRRIDELETR